MNGISFYNPQFFFALLFIAAIVLIHLLKRPHTLNLNFSTLRFFNQKAILSRKTRNLRKVIQLLIRCAAIAIVIFLFARPFDSSDPLNKLHNPQIPIYLWVDHSLSMDYNPGSMSLGQLSLNIVDSLQKSLSASSKLYLYDHNGETYHLKEKPETFTSSHGQLDLEKALEYFQNTSFKADPVIILFSDFQAPVKNILKSKLSEINKKMTVICVPVTPSTPWNYSLQDAKINQQNDITIDAVLQTYGKSIKSGEVVAEINNMRVGREMVQLSENKSSMIKINCNALSDNTLGKLSLNLHDPLLFDNLTYFVTEASSSNKVIIIGDKKECFPIAFALTASSKKMWDPVIIKTGSEITFDELDSADLIIINKLVSPSKALNAFLNDRSENNKPVIFCYGVEDEYNEWSDAIISEMLPSLSSCTLKNSISPLSPVLPDTTSELWKKFQKICSEDVSIYKLCSGVNGDVLLRLTDGSPLLIKTEDKKGRKWLVLTTPLGVTTANNLSETGFFVPFVDRMCRYILSFNQLSKESWVAGKLYKNPYFGSGHNFTIFDDESKIVKMVQKDQPYFLYEKPGIYKIVPQNERSHFLVVQSDPAESVLKYSIPDDSDIAKSKVIVINNILFLSTVAKNGNNSAIFLLWIMLAILLLAEIFLWERSRSYPS